MATKQLSRLRLLSNGTRPLNLSNFSTFSRNANENNFRQNNGWKGSLLPKGLSSRNHQIEQRRTLDNFNYMHRRFCSTAPVVTSETEMTAEERENAELARGKLLMSFICKVCDVRLTKTVSKLSYKKGVVIIKCDSCKNFHLIADNLGWFGDEKINIEDIVKSKGEEVVNLSSDSVEWVLKDVVKKTQTSE